MDESYNRDLFRASVPISRQGQYSGNRCYTGFESEMIVNEMVLEQRHVEAYEQLN